MGWHDAWEFLTDIPWYIWALAFALHLLVGGIVLVNRPRVGRCIALFAGNRASVGLAYVLVCCLFWPFMRTALIFAEWFAELVSPKRKKGPW